MTLRSDQIAALSLKHRALSTATIAFHEAVGRRLGVTAAERKCMGVLVELESCTPSHLASRTGLTTGAITGIVNRLHRAGYLERKVNPHDGRSMMLSVRRREQLEQMMTPVLRSLGTAMSKLAQEYSDSEIKMLLRYVEQTTEVLLKELRSLQQEAPAPRLNGGMVALPIRSQSKLVRAARG